MDLSNVFLLPAPAGKAAVALAAALLLAGCAVGPDYRTPEVAVPAAWDSADEATPTGAPLLERWWRRLGDPRLDALIEEAVAGNLDVATAKARIRRSEEHTSELQSLMRISYAVFCLKKKKQHHQVPHTHTLALA